MLIHSRSLHDLTREVCEPAASYAAAAATASRGTEPGWLAQGGVHAVPCAIRVPVPAGEVACPRCGEKFLAAGPTGFVGEQPICDMCLLEGSQPLGMLLALASVVRAFGALDAGSGSDYLDASEQLAAFARIYEIVAAKSGPPRPFHFPDLEAE